MCVCTYIPSLSRDATMLYAKNKPVSWQISVTGKSAILKGRGNISFKHTWCRFSQHSLSPSVTWWMRVRPDVWLYSKGQHKPRFPLTPERATNNDFASILVDYPWTWEWNIVSSLHHTWECSQWQSPLTTPEPCWQTSSMWFQIHHKSLTQWG